jgi:vitamin B12 transporter
MRSMPANENGEYQFNTTAKGEYQVRVRAGSFEPALSPVVRVGDNAQETVNLTLAIGGLTASVVVTATGTPMPQAQAGASVDVLDMEPYSVKLDAQDALRLVPGFQFGQIGQRGGTTQLMVRGGPSDANKVVVDGVPVNDVGGNFDFANLGTNAFQQVEIYRGPNSILYGSDTLSSVIEFTSKQGSTPIPELQYSADGGNFGQHRQEVSLGGMFHNFDYFGNYVRLDTNNSIPRNRFHNSAGSVNLGWTPFANTTIRATARRIVTASEQPNGLDFFAIPDDAEQREQDTFFGITLQNQTTPKWHNLLRYSGIRLRGQYTDIQPTGIPYDPFNTGTPLDYIGETVTLRGGNGYSVTGQALFQYPGQYPSQYITQTNRDFLYFQSHYEVAPWLNALFGFRFEDERGNTISLPYDSISSTARKNFSYTLQFSGGIQSRLFYTAGVGVDDNAVFGLVATPRGSLAYHLIRPRPNRIFSGTKLRVNFGQGIKEPSIDQQANSLYGILVLLGHKRTF